MWLSEGQDASTVRRVLRAEDLMTAGFHGENETLVTARRPALRLGQGAGDESIFARQWDRFAEFTLSPSASLRSARDKLRECARHDDVAAPHYFYPQEGSGGRTLLNNEMTAKTSSYSLARETY